jgi:F-type H+-transporting ATPase subunit b
MLFDWFTTIAQVVNFIILLVVLKYLLYDRVLGAIDRRRSEIEQQRQDARDARTEAEEEAERYREQREEIDSSRKELLEEARKEADERRGELLDEARDEIEERRSQWLQSLEDEKERLVDRISASVGRSVLDVSERMLAELADESLQQATVAAFARYLGHLDDDERSRITEALQDEKIVVVSAFELDDEARGTLTDAVSGNLAGEIGGFETDEDLIAGIQLAAGGRSVGWSLRDHLHELTSDLDAELSEHQGGTA